MNTSFCRTLPGSNFGGLLLEQTFCWHFAALPPCWDPAVKRHHHFMILEGSSVKETAQPNYINALQTFFKLPQAQSTRTAKFDPRTLSRKCSRKCTRECTRRCPRKCPRRLRCFVCKTHQRVPMKTPTRVLTGNFLVLTGNFPVLTGIFQCSRKCARSIFTCPIFTCFVFADL